MIESKTVFRTSLCFLHAFFLFAVMQNQSLSGELEPVPDQINAVRFDPSYYYDAKIPINKLCERLTEEWQNAQVNTVFFKAYDPVYGAKYRSKYLLNQMADYGRQDLLKYMIRACREHQIKIMAWIPAFQHKNAWLSHPEWRVKSADGTDYQPPGSSYPLCSANPNYQTWWLGFLQDLLERYPELDGIDIGEPVVAWSSGRCYCDHCRSSGNENISSLGLSEIIARSVHTIHSKGKIAAVTSVVSVHPDGRLFNNAQQQNLSGFNMDAILSNPERPDWLSIELIWQQWAHTYGNPALFTPTWIEGAAKEVKRIVGEAAELLIHLELTPFGANQVDAQKLLSSAQAAKRAGVAHIDLYDTHQIDEQRQWQTVKHAFEFVPVKKVLVLSDSLGENDSRQIASIISHFQASVTLHLSSKTDSYPPGLISGYDAIFYVGVAPKYQISANLLREMTYFPGIICWINLGIDQLLTLNPGFLPNVKWLANAFDTTFNRVLYKEKTLRRSDPDFVALSISDTAFGLQNVQQSGLRDGHLQDMSKLPSLAMNRNNALPDTSFWTTCQVLAEMTDGNRRYPYVLHCGRFWYFADLVTAFVVEGDRHVVFADLLHDILENHREQHLAMVRIEDVTPVSDIKSLRAIADYLHGQDIPFSVALVPFYLDPASNTAVSLSDQPEFVKTMHYMVEKGGVIVMHGSTHQYRDESTADYEFWDGMTNRPLFSDSREYVRERMEAGLAELQRNNLYPLIWETPHYAASQMDYEQINTYFSTSYERRQSVDLHGSDLLLPYFIYHHSSGGQIIPENMGFVPLEQQSARPILDAAGNYLAIRDGVASFFFHPFIDLSVLKEIVAGMKKMGYRFVGPKSIDNWVRTEGMTVFTGVGQLNMTLKDHFFHEFFIDEDGNRREESISDSLMTGEIVKTVQAPAGWIYVAERLPEKPKNYFTRMVSKVAESIPHLNDFIGEQNLIPPQDVQALQSLILIDSTATGLLWQDQVNLFDAFAFSGVDIKAIDVAKFLSIPEGINVVVVPNAASRRLNEQQNLFLIHALQSGTHLILEKESAVSAGIGLQPGEQVKVVQQVVDEYFPQVEIKWKQPDSLREFNADIDYVTYYSDKTSGLPVVIGGEYGSGTYLYWGCFFDPYTKGGYGRFPYFLDIVKNQFNLAPAVRRDAVEIYFDPGSREDISIEDLIKLWRNRGVRKIYAAAWHIYPEYVYDYERLISLAHQNAMSVYAWLELPMVSDKFWLDHPQWREKTATGRDAEVDWRKLMAVDVPECRQAIIEFLQEFLIKYDWDGINFAELYYESPSGPARPQNFTPFHPYIRDAFKKLNGFDPTLLFKSNSPYYWSRNPAAMEKFYRFREDNIFQLHQQFLQFIYNLKESQHRDWGLILTTIDHFFAPEVGRYTAVNTVRLLTLMKQYPFTLQIEDPQALWSLGPDRYSRLIDKYRELLPSGRFILDINVVPFRDLAQTQAPTDQPTGLELGSLVRAASRDQTRVAIYSESSLYEVDFPMLPYILAGASHEEMAGSFWRINAPFTVGVLVDADSHADIMVDNNIWPAYYRGRIILPKGEHRIEPVSRLRGLVNRFYASTRLVDLSSELLDVERLALGLEIEYEDDLPGYLIISEEPKQVLIDDQEIKLVVIKGESGYSIKVPSGRHRATIYTQSRGIHLMKQTSIMISGTIILIGSFAGTILAVIYVKNAIKRKRKNRKKRS